ncbi:hypothetical protein [Streptomyces lunaelactis]|uniref:hypothetical protein n=1 Tax=Streptomyces lunaelactis TaxID=1535768 RepID=UPI0015847E46|nr:hypothetical protein [Streptomyces lunaelactis]NUK22044.1 hypothetical protein [Streptomyces lunaelactis]
MTAGRLATAAYPLLLFAGVVVLMILMAIETRRERRAAARAAERRARPHSAHVGTAAQDAAAILTTAIQEQRP